MDSALSGKMSISNMIGTKEQMATYFQEEAKKDFQEMMEKLLESPPPKLMQKLARCQINISALRLPKCS
jgi:hypothetical protein